MAYVLGAGCLCTAIVTSVQRTRLPLLLPLDYGIHVEPESAFANKCRCSS
jgi:hypothetical protein